MALSGINHGERQIGDAYRFWLPRREPLRWPGDRASEPEKHAWRERLAAHARAARKQSQKAP
jgi:hypothetical protein